MAGSIGNTNAEKWDRNNTIQLLDTLINRAITKPCYLLINALCEIVTIDQYEYLKTKWKEDEIISQLFKRLVTICESNITEGMLTGKVKETASIFLLKSKYGYIDKQTTEIEFKGTVNINLALPQCNNLPDNVDIA